MNESTLVERLNIPWPEFETEEVTLPAWVIELCAEGAARITALEAENERLKKALERVPDEAGHWAYVHCRVHIGSEHEDELSEFVTQKVRSLVEGVLAQNRETE